MRRYLPYIILIILGLGISLTSFVYLNASPKEEVSEYTKVVVAARDIPAYKKIEAGDLTFKEILSSEANKDIVTDPQAIIGMYSESTLFADWPINARKITENQNLANKHIIVINVDYARSAAAKPGDIVDVYYVKAPMADWTSSAAEKVASDVIVVSIEDENGNDSTINNKGLTAHAILAVDTANTHKLIPGAIKDNASYVLAVRNEITENSALEEPLADQVQKEGE